MLSPLTFDRIEKPSVGDIVELEIALLFPVALFRASEQLRGTGPESRRVTAQWLLTPGAGVSRFAARPRTP